MRKGMLYSERKGIAMKPKRAKRERRKEREAPSMDAILKYPNAQAFFDKLVSNGGEPDALVTVLQNAAQFLRRGGGGEAITPEGIAIYTIKRLPNRPEEMASTIERIEAHQHWTVQRAIIPRPPAEATPGEHARLP